MKEDYIATFYSHYEAMCFKKKCDQQKIPATLMPVPRDLSSSCGTCVLFQCEENLLSFISGEKDDIEMIVKCEKSGYTYKYQAENS